MGVNVRVCRIDSAAADVGHVQSERESWKRRDATNADQGSRWRAFFFPHS